MILLTFVSKKFMSQMATSLPAHYICKCRSQSASPTFYMVNNSFSEGHINEISHVVSIVYQHTCNDPQWISLLTG